MGPHPGRSGVRRRCPAAALQVPAQPRSQV